MHQPIDLFLSPLLAFWQALATSAPKVLAALLLLTAGWLLARLARATVRRVLPSIGFDRAAERSGLEAIARLGGIELSLSRLLAEITYWLVLLLIALSAMNSLGLDMVAGLLRRIVLYLPNVFVAVLVLVFGTLLARLVNRALFAWLHAIKVPNPLAISTFSEYAVQFFAVFMALEQLAIATQLLTALFTIAFGAVMLALALAFGLGGRDWAAERLRTWFAKTSD